MTANPFPFWLQSAVASDPHLCQVVSPSLASSASFCKVILYDLTNYFRACELYIPLTFLFV